MYKLFIETSGRRARLVPGTSTPTIAEKVFGQLSAEAVFASKGSLENEVYALLEERGIPDAETYTITIPDNLRAAEPAPELTSSPETVSTPPKPASPPPVKPEEKA